MRKPQNTERNGAVMLMAVTMAVKVLGIAFKVPLTNLLGMEGMGYFSAAYQIFGFVYGSVMAGLPPAVATETAAACGSGWYAQMRRIGKTAVILFPCIGAAAAAILFFAADPLARAVGTPKAAAAVAAISPTVFFSCWMGACKGYDQGLGRMGPIAASQLTEGILRPVFGIAAVLGVMELAVSDFAKNGMVWGVPVFTEEGARRAALPIGAAAAVGAVALSEACAAVVLRLCHRGGMDGFSRETISRSPAPLSHRKTVKNILRRAIPITVGSLITGGANMIDLTTVCSALQANAEELCRLYGTAVPILTRENVSAVFYGAYQTAMNLYWLVPAVTAAFGTVALPRMAAAAAIGDRRSAQIHMQRTVTLSNTVCMGAGAGLAVLARPILNLLYGGQGAQISLAVGPLQVLGVTLCLTGISGPCVSMMQGMGKGRLLVWFTAASAGTKLLVNACLARDPRVNTVGAALGTFASGCVLTICCIWYLIKHVGKISPVKAFFCPLAAAAVCAVTASGVMSLRPHVRWWVLPSIAAGLTAWLAALWLFGDDTVLNFFRRKN